MRLEVDVADKLHEHVKHLTPYLESLQAWKSSEYGQIVQFCDIDTFQDVSEKIKLIAQDAAAVARGEVAPLERSLEKSLANSQKAMKILIEGKGEKSGNGVSVTTGARSAAPCSLDALKIMPENHQIYWKTGETISADTNGHTKKVPNPMFASLMTDDCKLHYGSDPVLDFHLATGFAPLKSNSPLHAAVKEPLHAASVAAKTQFSIWIRAFQDLLGKGAVVVRMIASDALAFCHTLQYTGSSQKLSTGWYRRQFDLKPLMLDDAYLQDGLTPTKFDTIDSSNLADHFGTLNILIATTPLLEAEPWATTSTELLLKLQGDSRETLRTLLCGDPVVVCLLLGISPIQYWTNSKCESHMDEIFLQMMQSNLGASKQLRSLTYWKRDDQLSGANGGLEKLEFDQTDLLQILLGVYREMHGHEKISANRGGTSSGYTHFHRGSFVAFLKMAKNRVKVDWNRLCENLIAKISGIDNLLQNSQHMQEFQLQLHLQNVWTSSSLHTTTLPSLHQLKGWEDVPLSVAMSLVVPRKEILKLFEGHDRMQLVSPSIIAFIRVAGEQTLFSDAHLAWGTIKGSDASQVGKGEILVEEDNKSWNGDSPLIATFVVPTKILEGVSNDTLVGLRISSSDTYSLFYLPVLGMEMTIFERRLKDIFITKHPPRQVHKRVDCGIFGSNSDDKQTSETSKTFLSIQMNGQRISTITGHIDITSDKGKKLLKDKVPISVRGTPNPFMVRIHFSEARLILDMNFPVAVNSSEAKMRVARTSGYIEAILPVAEPPSASALHSFMFPSILNASGVPASLNMPYLNLESLPILDLEQKSRLGWLTTLGSMQWSARQKKLREIAQMQELVGQDTIQLDFKESMFTMLMLASGLQGGQTGLFALHRQKPVDDGIHMLFFISALRLDGDTGSVVLDGAVLPLEMEHLTAGLYEDFLLVMREMQCSNIYVNDEELHAWKQMLPAMVERCRTWSHLPSCEYTKKGATIPLSLEAGKQVICSCGRGKLPKNYMGLPHWDDASPYAVRVALSPTFAVPLVEDVVDPESMTLGGSGSSSGPKSDTCRACGKGEGEDPLKKCSGCKRVKYCSVKCQKKDWKKHRMECEPTVDV